MLKKFALFLCTFFVLTVPNTQKLHSLAADKSAEKLINEANRELSDDKDLKLKGEYFKKRILLNGKSLILNDKLVKGMWSEYDKLGIIKKGKLKEYSSAFVYGKPFSDKRYLGRTVSGGVYYNFFFPHDSWQSGKTLEEFNWIGGNWKKYESTAFDYPEVGGKYLKNIVAGLEFSQKIQGDDFKIIDKKNDTYKKINWSKYVHIMQPPTSRVWGSGIMWNRSHGKNWYFIVPIPSDTASDEILQSTTVTSRFFDDKGNKIKDDDAKTYDLSHKDDGETLKIYIQVKKIRGYKYTGYDTSKKEKGDYTKFQKSGNADKIAIKISKKTGRLYVNHYFQKKLDVSVESINPKNVYADETSLICVEISNDGQRGIDDAKVRFMIMGKTYIETIHLPENTTSKVYFKWKAPPEKTVLSAKASVEIGEEYNEESDDRKNNEMKTKINVFKRKGGSYAFPKKIPALLPPGEGGRFTANWSEKRLIGYRSSITSTGASVRIPVYKNFDFWAKLAVNIKMNPSNKIKSGRGFGMKVETHVTTNYDKKDKITGIQTVSSTVPEYGYSPENNLKYVSKKPGKSRFDGEWTLVKNRLTKMNLKKWYVPVWFEDRKKYVVHTVCKSAYTPGGELFFKGNTGVVAIGSMYDEDVTR